MVKHASTSRVHLFFPWRERNSWILDKRTHFQKNGVGQNALLGVSFELFFSLHCQIHLAMAPWGATDGRATVPLDPVEDGKFGQQPFFQSKTKPPKSRTTSRRPNILLSYGSTIHVSHATAYESSPVHASNYLQKDCTQTTGCIVCDEKWLDVLCCITRTRGNGSVNY